MTRGGDTVTSIDGALAAMDRIVERALDAGDRGGYFAAVYRAVTARVRDGLVAGEFDDPDRMERFDVLFAQRYLDALHDWTRARRVPQAWALSFETAGRPDRLILQHVLLGINAHINLDLGLAAADATGPGRIDELRNDFERINDVLAELVDRMQDAIATVSPWIGLVDAIGLRFDEALVTFSLRRARAEAWSFAASLTARPRTGWQELATARDLRVADLASRIANPGVPLRWGVRAARWRERDDLADVVDELRRRGAAV